MRVVRSVRERESRTSLRCRNRVRLFQIKEAEWTALGEISPERRGFFSPPPSPARGCPPWRIRCPHPGPSSSGSSTPSSRISSPRRHRTARRPRSLSGLVRLAGAPSQNGPSFRKNKSRGKRAKAANPGFVEPSRGDVEKGSVSRPLFPRERRREAAGRSRRALREAQPADVRGFAPESHRPS